MAELHGFQRKLLHHIKQGGIDFSVAPTRQREDAQSQGAQCPMARQEEHISHVLADKHSATGSPASR